MSRRAPRALALAALALIIAGVAYFTFARPGGSSLSARSGDERPVLLLLTALPIVFPEELTLDAPASPVLEALERRYRVQPISVAGAEALRGNRLLLMAQPQAQPAETLVELDQWVREGGRVVLLSDPALAWPSERSLGDALRPPMSFADTGLLGHWGLRLDGPDQLGPVALQVDGKQISTISTGTLAATSPKCQVVTTGLIARCEVGKGQATVIGDADFLKVDNGDHVEGVSPETNLSLLLDELARLEK